MKKPYRSRCGSIWTARPLPRRLLNALYEKTVPEPLREYLDSKAAPAAVKPKRTGKPAAPKPQSSEPKPAAVKEGN